MITALISARGGSTRIHKKNLYPLCGHPLVAWSIMQAQGCKQVDRVILTTDDDEIAEVGEQYGAQVIRRPVWENGVTLGVAFKHAMEQVGPCDHILTLLPTSPLKKPDDLDTMISLYLEREIDYIITASPLKETCFYVNEEPYEQRYGIDYNEPGERQENKHFLARNFVFDKCWNYSRLCGGWGIAGYDWSMDQWSKNARLDIEIESNELDIKTIHNCYAVEEWQCYELDYMEDIKIVECFMETFILKGRKAEDVYIGN